ncbi:MAG: FAD-dependent oxidoreductase [Candidatus Anstonellaceae archaeon]
MAAGNLPKIVIAGCGFGGMAAALDLHGLLKDKAKILAIDKTDRFDYHASLPELVSGKISRDSISIPYESLFSRLGIEFLQAKISKVDWKKKLVLTDKGKVKYDYLVLAVGSQTNFYDIPGAKEHCFEFKIDLDAIAIREHVTKMFESCSLSEKDDGSTRIVVVGGGLTGVELVTDLKDLLDKVCARCNIPDEKREIVLVGRSEHLNPGFSAEVSDFIESYLRKQGIALVLGNPVKKVEKDCVVLSDGKKIIAKTIIWCAGIKPASVAEQFGSKGFNSQCGLVLNKYLQCIADPTVFAVGDCGYCSAFEVQPVLTALRAIEQSDYACHNLCCEINGNRKHKMQYVPRYFPAFISLGRGMGVLSFHGIWLKGRRIAWLKKISEKIHLARFRHNWSFLEYFDALMVSVLEFYYFMIVRRR